jgi:hypothetical protein
MDPDRLITFLANGHLWLVFGVAFAGGMLGAAIHRWSTADAAAATTPPTTPPTFGGDILSGGIAAAAMLYVTDPTTGAALIGGSLVAGFAAKTVMAGLEARITSALAHREAADNKREADVAKRHLENLVGQVSSLPEPEAPAQLGGSGLADVKQLARGIKAQLLLQ